MNSATVWGDRECGYVPSQENDRSTITTLSTAAAVAIKAHRPIPVPAPRSKDVVGEDTDPEHDDCQNQRQHDDDNDGAQNWHSDALYFLLSGRHCSHRGPDEEHPDQPVDEQEREDPGDDQRGHSESASSVLHTTLYPSRPSW